MPAGNRPFSTTWIVLYLSISQLVYAMSALSVPMGAVAVNKMDSRRRSFLWNGDNSASPAQSFIAWERVCLSKEQGGLGIKNLGLQNICLLLKLLHRLHCSQTSLLGPFG